MCIFSCTRAATAFALLFGTVAVISAPTPQNEQLESDEDYAMHDARAGIFPNGINGGGYPFNGNGMSIDNFQLSPNCSIMNDVLFINGVSKGYLTPQQRVELQQFQEKALKWSEAFIAMIQQQVAQGLGSIFGDGSTMHMFQSHAGQSNVQQMQYPSPDQYGSMPSLPPFPEFPSFCK